MARLKERFNELFERSKLSQEEFGKLFGASKSQVFNWRDGRGEPDSEMVKTIAKTCNVSVAWLLGYDDEINNITIDNIIKHAEKMNLSSQQKEALEKYKIMQQNEQNSRLNKILNKLKSLSAEDQEALARIISSLPSRQ